MRVAAVVFAFLPALAGCSPTPPESPPSTTATVTESPRAAAISETPAISSSTAPAADPAAAAALADAAATARACAAAHLDVFTRGIENLTANSYAADVTADPPTARGSADLLIDGHRRQTDFLVENGHLWITNTDGSREDVGPARGALDPTALLDPNQGLAALLGLVTAATADNAPPDDTGTTVAGRPAQLLHALLPRQAATILLPAASIGARDQVPVRLWLDRSAGHALVQLIADVGDGSFVLSITPAPARS